MRAVNLIPEELRPRIPGDGDPRIAYGVLGGLAILLLMVVVAISYSNKLKTIEDQTAAINAEAQQHKSLTSAVTITPDEVGKEIKNRTLLVGGLSQLRFPWGTALYDLSRSLPEDVTLDSINASSASSAAAGAAPVAGALAGATMDLTGCTSGWIGYSRLMTWLETMPGVAQVKSNSSSVSPPTGADGDSAEATRAQNCGPAPLTFTLQVTYKERAVDLLGLPKPEGDAAGGATGTTGAAGVPAAATTPAPGAEG